jgi:hypothetical protein
VTAWGGLNPALTAWRDGVNALFPDRGRASDGGYADAAHGSASQHQQDPDGSVDAFDEDVNLLGSGAETGTDAERALVDALNADFEADPRAHLWISRRRIAQHNTAPPWDEKYYGRENPHDKHTHREARQDREHDGRPWQFPHARALLRTLNGDDVDNDDIDRIVERLLASDSITNLYEDSATNPKVTVRTALRAGVAADVRATRIERQLAEVSQKLDGLLTAVRLQGNG